MSNFCVRSREFIKACFCRKTHRFLPLYVLGNRSKTLLLPIICKHTDLPTASRLRSEGISQNTRDSPSTQLYCCRKRYLPFPCPVTGSMIPCSAISRSKAVHLVGFRSSTLCTSDLPNTISFPKASCNLRTCEAVFAVKSSSMFTFLFSMFAFSESMFTFSGSLKVPLMCNIRL